MTKGEMRVGISFNPSKDANVDAVKRSAADLIDLIDNLPKSEKLDVASEQGRLKSIAMHDVETAAMYAVKAATKDF